MTFVIEPGWAWDAENGLRSGVHVIVRDGIVADVVRERPTLDARRIAAPDALLLPGFINLHNHALSAPLFRGLADDIAPGDIPGHIVFSLLMPLGGVAASVMTEEEIGDAAEMALLEGLRSGMTGVLDVHRVAQWPFIERAKRLGLRSWTCPYTFSETVGMTQEGKPTYTPTAETGFEATLALFDRFDEGPKGVTRVGFGPHGPDSNTPELLRRIDAAARERQTVVSIHAAQNLIEIARVKELHGKGSIDHLRDLGLLRPGVVLAHGMFATDEEFATIAAEGAALASCPLAFARSGRFVPLARIEASGLRLGIGTDGVTLDMLQEIRTASIFAKVQSGTPHGLTAPRILRAATRDAALALGRDDLGLIAPGQRADLVMFDLSSSRYQPVWDPLKALITNGSAADLMLAMVEGRVLLRDGTVLSADAAAVTRRGRAAIARVWQEAARCGAIPPSIAARAAFPLSG
ncbi:amidohydrolase family protein [Falsiroseomonas oryziterrae]|uniref:amidohydrolase family protein n=1 Tax=Falsiroseomonas oryziterrae TaxID=2911368 RepID=UPI001F2928AC|nr:amidohydrolase family protein [Roseomonas sp. NPKOSM-4]